MENTVGRIQLLVTLNLLGPVFLAYGSSWLFSDRTFVFPLLEALSLSCLHPPLTDGCLECLEGASSSCAVTLPSPPAPGAILPAQWRPPRLPLLPLVPSSLPGPRIN